MESPCSSLYTLVCNRFSDYYLFAGDDGHEFQVGFHFGSKKSGKISRVFEVLSRNSVFFRTDVKP